jgi:hypothetical protein|tara:strand:- start:1425 stop:1637 length:213 start_codon:yes stop_codon:yes gene_type:complete
MNNDIQTRHESNLNTVKTKYFIEFELTSGKVETMEVETDNLSWTLEQIGRNRMIKLFMSVKKIDGNSDDN